MEFDDFSGMDRFEERSQRVQNSEYWETFDTSLSELISFYESLAFLIFDKPVIFVSKEGKFHMYTELINSVVFTLNSVKWSAKRGCLADAYTLTRKMKDDLLLYLYFIGVEERYSDMDGESTDNHSNSKDPTKKAIEWMNNKMSDLHTGDILSFLRKNKKIKEVIEEHNLQDNFERVKVLLNDCVHTNGKGYALLNHGFEVNFEEHLGEIERITNLITIIFLTFLILIKPHFISSTEYVDALDVGMTPEKGSQYWVAPFIQNFIDENINDFDPKLKEFLSNSTFMEID